jgi:hypothetical protein
MYTRWFSNLDEVEYVFDITLSGDQAIMILDYLMTGQRPDPRGCWTCSPAAMRILTAQIDSYERQLDEGEVEWPWTVSP